MRMALTSPLLTVLQTPLHQRSNKISSGQGQFRSRSVAEAEEPYTPRGMVNFPPAISFSRNGAMTRLRELQVGGSRGTI